MKNSTCGGILEQWKSRGLISPWSWVFLLLSVVIMVLMGSQVVAEERGCLEIHGDEYQEYMNRTPRWIGIPKSR